MAIAPQSPGWVSSVVNSVTNAVRANGSGWLASLWNTAVSLVGTAISVTINGLTNSLVAFITKIASICGTLMQVASMFKPWTVKLAANPSTITLDGYAEPGAFDATLDAKDIPWPPELVSCVTEVSGGHINLTDASYKNATVTWTHPVNIPGLATKQSEDDALLDDKTAHYTYATETVEEPPRRRLPDARERRQDRDHRHGEAFRHRQDLEVDRVADHGPTQCVDPKLLAGIHRTRGRRGNHCREQVRRTARECDRHAQAKRRRPVVPAHRRRRTRHRRPSPSPTAAGFVNLPFKPCNFVISAADTQQYLGGAVVLPDKNGAIAKTTEFIAGLASAGSANAGPSDYDGTRASTCALGTIGPDGEPKALVGMFSVIPRGPGRVRGSGYSRRRRRSGIVPGAHRVTRYSIISTPIARIR